MTEAIQPTGSNLPERKKGLPPWGGDYLVALERAQGTKTKAAEIIGKDYSTVYKSMQTYLDFARAVDNLKAYWDSKNLDELESISMIQAKKPGCVTERFFNMKAIAPDRYRDRSVGGQVTAISIVLGVAVPKAPDFSQAVLPPTQEIPAEVTVVSTNSRSRPAGDEILSDEDLDF